MDARKINFADPLIRTKQEARLGCSNLLLRTIFLARAKDFPNRQLPQLHHLGKSRQECRMEVIVGMGWFRPFQVVLGSPDGENHPTPPPLGERSPPGPWGGSTTGHILFSRWSTFGEQKWITFGERPRSRAALGTGKHPFCMDAQLRRFVQRLAGGMIGHTTPNAPGKAYNTDFIQAV
jgi:hypothetical protein